MPVCSACGKTWEANAEPSSPAVCPDCTASAAPTAVQPAASWRRWLNWKGILLGIVCLFVVACLGRETGWYDFRWTRQHTQLKTSYNLNRQGSPRFLIRWSEVPDGVRLDFADGSQGLMTVDQMSYGGFYYLPLYKRFRLKMHTSFQSQDGRLRGTAEGTAEAWVFGFCSIRNARQNARVDILNQMCQSLTQRPL